MPILCDLRINGKTVATVEIRNDGTGTEQRGNYDVMLRIGDTRTTKLTQTTIVDAKAARVTFYDRSLGAVELLRQSLNALDDETAKG